ncbi:PP2C family protein-serine/threonine phosphatase [Streptomyces sp. CB03238]|uniref:PP2C family protein-serine/threonine phosphatase n=1 Tax=Streptomyces sp. CB03238 TaxID=1907777 RepID=UPI000A11092D|nr:PP2C family protein-serine/threonine phosphatase [Streptomyces sp. CB03238]ORT59953.1 phosphatase [Streptomyces sp. CB03238]
MLRTRAWVRRLAPLALPALWGGVAVLWKLTCPLAHQEGTATRIATSAVFFTVGTGLVLGLRRGLARELKQVRAVAQAAQQVLLRPLPPRLEGLSVAAAQLSVARGAAVGGDLYEAVATPHGVRIVIGDVRGHGLAALGAVAAVLGSFREAAHDEPELGGVLRRLDRALGRHLRERAREEHPAVGGWDPDSPSAEEFVTVLLLEIRRDGAVLALNCGHPWPYRLGSRTEQVVDGETLPPLGAFPLPDELPVHRCVTLPPGEALFLHTDGAEDARDASGRFFRLQDVLDQALHEAPVPPAALIHRVHAALLRHTGGRLTDDVALMVVRNDRRDDRSRVPAQSADPGLRRTRPAPSNR